MAMVQNLPSPIGRVLSNRKNLIRELPSGKNHYRPLFSSTNLIPSAVLAPEIPEIYLLEIGFGE